MYQSTPNRRLMTFFIALCCWNLIVSIDSTALSTALPTIAHDLSATSTEAFWLGTAFVLCSAAVQPVFASFSDSFGRKPIIYLSLSFFTIGAVVCGCAHQVPILLLGRCFQGAGGGGLLAMTYVTMSDELTIQNRHKAITVVSLTWLVGPVCGPILAGGFTELGAWRWVFWFNLPFCALGFLLAFLINCTYQTPYTGLDKLRRLDWIGSSLFVVALTSFLVSISWGGTMFAWSSWETLVPLLGGATGLAFWVLYSLKLTSRPMIPLRLILGNRTSCISFFGNLLHGVVFFGVLYYVPVFFQAVKQYSPIMSGVAMLPYCLTAGPSAALAGAVIARTNRIKPLALLGWLVFIGASGLLLLLSPNTKTVAWVFIELPGGFAVGLLYATLAIATQAAVETSKDMQPEDVLKIKGQAAALNPFFRTIGQTLGIVICQTAFTNELKKRLGNGVAKDFLTLATALKSLPKSSPAKPIIEEALNESLKPVWYVLLSVCCVGVILTLATRDIGPGLSCPATRDIETSSAASSPCNDSQLSFEEIVAKNVHDGLCLPGFDEKMPRITVTSLQSGAD